MTRLRRLLVSALVTAGLASLPAGAAPSLVSPASGSSLTSSHPTFRWSLPAGEVGESISVGRSSQLAPTGDFATADLADAAILEPDQASWTTIRALEAGRYWWHVASHTDTKRHIFSPLRSFTIRPAVTLESIEVKTFKPQRTFLITVSWRANVHKVAYAAELRQGSKRLVEKKVMTDNFLIDSKKLDVSTWIIPATVKKGASLRFSLSLIPQGGPKVTVSRALRAP